MNQNFPFPPISKDEERRRALAKVYSLLIRLAEETESQPIQPETISEEEEKIEESIIRRTDTFKQAVFPFFDPDVATLKTEQPDNPVPSQ